VVTVSRKRTPDMPIAVVLELSIIGSTTATALPALQTLVESMMDELKKRFEAVGGSNPHTRRLTARPARYEELLTFVPRKKHFSADDVSWICDTAHVSRFNLTRDTKAVTCKLCRRELGLPPSEET